MKKRFDKGGIVGGQDMPEGLKFLTIEQQQRGEVIIPKHITNSNTTQND